MHAWVRGWVFAACLFAPALASADDPAAPAPAAAPAAPTAASAPPAPDAPAPLRSPSPSTPTLRWAPFGYLRMQYIAVQDDPNVAFVGRADGFELQNARVGVRGQLGRAYFTLSIDGAVDERLQLNSTEGKLKVALRDGYVDVDLLSDDGDASARGLNGENAVVVRGGFFQNWVEPEAQIPDFKRDFVDRPLESRGMRATEGYQTPGLTPGRSLGVAVRRDPAAPTDRVALGFELAAQNGADEYASNNDNDALALSAAVLVRFPHDGWVVGALRWNPRTVGNLPFRQDETDYQASLGAHLVAGPLAVGVGGLVMTTRYETTHGPSQNSYGAHAQAMVALPVARPLAVGYRFAVLNPSSLISTDRVIEHTIGAVLGVPSLRMRFQLQATHVTEQVGRELQNDRVQLAAELAL